MLRKFIRDRRGNYAMMTSILAVPLLGALGLAVDYAEMSRQRQATLDALDAAGIATARRIAQGVPDTEAKQFADDFFRANLGHGVDPENAQLSIVLPKNNVGGGTLLMTAHLKYKTYFFGAFQQLAYGESTVAETKMDFSATSEIRLKNTLEVALVLDNSGSMDSLGSGSGEKRIDLLKKAAKELVDTLAKGAEQMKQVQKPVQFGLVPFAASVNVGPSNANATWMDRDGISPIHHENFDWTAMATAYGNNKKVENVGGVFYKKGSGWGTQQNQKMTRFTLYDDMQYVSATNWEQTGTKTEEQCTGSGKNRVCRNVTVPVYGWVDVYSHYAAWQGCVEARPHPYNVNDTAPSSSTPATLFVPMFAPDETDLADGTKYANNMWSTDKLTGSSNSAARQRYTAKYYDPAMLNSAARISGGGPNLGCTTKPITPLTDVTTAAGKTAINNAIDAMVPDGGTNVPEGLAWGWRVVSSAEPFTQGRAESERGNDKVVIVLTDGENTYYTPGSVRSAGYSTNSTLGGNDLANNKSTYSAYGYARLFNGTAGRIFGGTSVSKTDFSNGNYTKAMNEHMATLCTNAKASGAIVMTVALDLDKKDAAQKAQIDALTACASESRFTKKKLFWNATGKSLAEDFKKIGDELSNLRIVG